MSENNTEILKAISLAMEAEKKANEFYRQALAQVQSERGKNLLRQLADFEQNHYNKLNDLKQQLTQTAQFIEYPGTQFTPFTAPEAAGKIETNPDEILQILNLAIDAEDKAAKKYRQMAEQTVDPRGKVMFRQLAEEELSHRRILSDEFYHFHNQSPYWGWGD
jgi:rubrerythrin